MAEQTSFPIPEQRSVSAFMLPVSFNGNIGGRPRPLEPDLTSSGGIALPTPAIPGFMDGLGDLQTPAINRNLQPHEAFARPAPRNPFIDWYNSPEKPWDPIHGRAVPLPRSGDLRGAKLNYHRLGGQAYSTYRENHVPSECETTGPGALPSDSGYHSRATQSVFNGSACGDADRSGENGSISSHLAGLQVDRTPFSSEAWAQASMQTTTLVLAVDSGSLVCPTCHQKVKTKSELKKHKQKHEKPHRCDVPGCTRTEGFSTPNDVDRHKRSCHPEQQANGKCYRCIVPGCRKKEKKWPRADNFRQHLKRVHNVIPRDDDLEDYVYKEPVSPGPDLAGVGSVGADLRMDANHYDKWPGYSPAIQEQPPRYSANLGYTGQQMNQYQDANTANQQLHLMASNDAEGQLPQAAVQIPSASPGDDSTSMQLDHAQQDQHEQQTLDGVSDSASEDEFIEPEYLDDESGNVSEMDDEQLPSTTQTEVSMPNMKEPLQNHDNIAETIEDDTDSVSCESENVDVQDYPVRPEVSVTVDAVSLATVTIPSARDKRALDEAAHTASAEYPAVSVLSSEPSSLVPNRHEASEWIKALEHQGTLAGLLQELGYQKPRQPDRTPLTSHSISSAPYGCTYSQCDKRFGSKNDWKRHENSQHFQLELWKCSEPSRLDPSEKCGKACHRREQFRAHVSKEHAITDPTEIDQKLARCRVGRDSESRFWCGFCKTVVEISGKNKSGTERFNHIDDHYSGRLGSRMDISEWKSVDPDLPASSSPGSDRENPTASSQSSSSSSVGPSKGRKRDALAQQPTPRKRPRVAVETLWFCLHDHHWLIKGNLRAAAPTQSRPGMGHSIGKTKLAGVVVRSALRSPLATSFGGQGRSSFVHFNGPREHKRTTSAPGAPILLAGVEVQGGYICKDTQAKPGVSTEGTDKRERRNQVSIKCGSARSPTELPAKLAPGVRQPVCLSSSFCSSRLSDLLYIPSGHFASPPMSPAMASTTPIHFSEVFLSVFSVERSILYIIFHCRLPSVGPLSALSI
ncbi:hypothetical protein KVR01_001313 [Diaporthe batatas]|uniref:uncharacterized protein n=1 Tax=Diaporthe batatas TaxID=748121 RepID=UPI001D04F19A|nr:uncharacterized protein KVR01_001313 [Diaporthe batatas]KAG8168564.1 hypothetical protein KVR01_001313 [Diaporthe batatas]